MADKNRDSDNCQEMDEKKVNRSHDMHDHGKYADSDEKTLPSASSNSSGAKKDKKTLPSSSEHEDASPSEKQLPSSQEANNSKELKNEPETRFEEETERLSGDSLKDRIREATLAGGLNKLPPGFDDDNGDWQCINSENVFERLYLDWTLYQVIKPQMVEKNYQILRDFWEEKCALMHQGANRERFEKKYGRGIGEFLRRLDLAYKQLIAPGGIENTFRFLDERRWEKARNRLGPMLIKALDDKILEPKEEALIISFGLKDTELTEEEIKKLIDEELDRSGSKRGTDASMALEKAFFRQIKRMLSDNFLSIEEEEILKEDAPLSNIGIERLNTLILRALHEHGDAERESTLEQDKKRFTEFYYGLLRDYGLEKDDKLPEVARAKLLEKDNSETEFFPLRRENRIALEKETLKKYKADFANEKQQFYQEAIKRLDIFEQHDYGRQTLLEDTAFKLLLPEMRRELIERAIQEIVNKQSALFTQAAKRFYQMKFWRPTDEEIETFLENPNHPFDESWVRCDWLRVEQRKALFDEVAEWAQAEYAREVKEMRERIKRELKKYVYGLPVHLQNEIEADKQYHLSLQERREIVIELEQEHRKKAEQEFTERVKNNIVFNTLIPDREAALLEEGETVYLLNDAKIKQSLEVKTARTIIENLRKPFEVVVKKHVNDLVKKYKMDPEIVQTYELDHDAYISKKDFDSLIEGYQPKSQSERESLLQAYRKYAAKAGLHIIEKNRIAEFKELLYRAMEKASNGYKLSLKKWLTNKFRDDLVKVAAAFGVDRKTADDKFAILQNDYQEWTRPKWVSFFIIFFSITLFFGILRFLISVTGYDDWILASGPVQMYAQGELFDLISHAKAVAYAQSNVWGVISVLVAIIIFFISLSNLDGDDSGGAFTAAIFFAFVSGMIFRFVVVPWLIIFVFGNLTIIVGNLFILIWYVVQNTWAYIIKFITYLDYFLCGLPMEPVLAWTLWGGVVALIIGFFFATRGLRRSYFKYHASLTGSAAISFLVIFFISQKEIKAFENRQAALAENRTIVTVLGVPSSVIKLLPNQESQTLARPAKGAKVAILAQKGEWYKVKFNRFRETIEGYIFYAGVEKPRLMADKPVVIGRIIPPQGGLVRAAASKNAATITALPKDTQVLVVGKVSDWYRIRYKTVADSATGYVYHTIIQIVSKGETIPELEAEPVLVTEGIAEKTSKRLPSSRKDISQVQKTASPKTEIVNQSADTNQTKIAQYREAPREAAKSDDVKPISAPEETTFAKSVSKKLQKEQSEVNKIDKSTMKMQKKEQKERDTHRSSQKQIDKVGIEWVLIQGGIFKMGDIFGDGYEDEKPVHDVFVDDFYLAKYEVTVAQFRAFCDATGYSMPAQPPWSKDNHPVVNVTWEDAVAFCKWIGARLPTEAEWEYAARSRGGKSKKYAIGQIFNGKKANHADLKSGLPWASKWNDGYKYTAPVGSYPENDANIYDMSGNVWEWCADWYEPDYYMYSVLLNPKGPFFAKEKVLRGGSWQDLPTQLRVFNRGYSIPNVRKDNIGFRPARSIK